MTIRSQDASIVSDAIEQAIHCVLVMPDEAVRLAAFTYLREHFLRRITRERDKAAYEARLVRSGVDLEQITGSLASDIYRWAARYAHDNRLPVPRAIAHGDVTDAIAIAANAGVYRRGLDAGGSGPVVVEDVPSVPQHDGSL